MSSSSSSSDEDEQVVSDEDEPVSLVEEAYDESFAEDLKVRWTRRTPSLFEMTLDTICELDHKPCHIKYSLLPKTLVQKVHDYLELQSNDDPSPGHVCQLICDKLTRLCLKVVTHNWREHHFETITCLLESKAKDCLNELEVTRRDVTSLFFSEPQIRRILSCQTKIQHLSTTSLSVFHLIPTFLPDLESLTLIELTCFTEFDMQTLLSLKKLKKLSFTEQDQDTAELTADFLSQSQLVVIFENLPLLQSVTGVRCENALLKFVDKHGSSRQLHLCAIKISPRHSVDDISKLIAVLPDLNRIHLGRVKEISSLINVNKISEVAISVRFAVCHDYILENEEITESNVTLKDDLSQFLTSGAAENLFNLELHHVKNIDLSEVGKFCPNIQQLICSCESELSEKCKYEIEDHFFSKLKCFCVVNTSVKALPIKTLVQVLTRPSLRSFGCDIDHAIPNHVYKQIFRRARDDCEVFSNLKTVSLNCVDLPVLPRPTDVEIILEFLSLAPKLEGFWMENDPDTDRIIRRFVQRHALQIDINL